MDDLKEHPCYPCAYLKKPKSKSINLKLPYCICPSRNPKDREIWAVPNQLGEDCSYYTEGFQLLLTRPDLHKRRKPNAKDRK